MFSVVLATIAGCAATTSAGDEQFAEAETSYLRYRGFVNELQSTLSAGDWEIGQLGVYGMQPMRCDAQDRYRFDLNRSIMLDVSEVETYADLIEDFFADKSMSPKRSVLGSDGQEGQLIQVTVRNEGDFSLLLVEIKKSGRVRIAAETTCWPGDRDELSEMLFHGERLGDGYLPTHVEAPTDPLFFGITPGEPQFVGQTATPTATPQP